MAFDWSGYLDLAEDLAARTDEAAQRSAVSRAYYAALGKARELLEHEGRTLTSAENVHYFVWQAFSDSEDDRRYYISVDGNWLRRNRNAADYDPLMADPHGRAAQAVRKARSLLAALERIRT